MDGGSVAKCRGRKFWDVVAACRPIIGRLFGTGAHVLIDAANLQERAFQTDCDHKLHRESL